jgi:hypothetical protein
VCPGLAHQTVSGAPGWTSSNSLPSGFPGAPPLLFTGLSGVTPDSVRWHTGLSGVPAEQQLSARNGRLCKVNSAIQNVRAEVRGAPDCPVRHRTVRCHKRTEPPTVDQLQALTIG